VGDAADGVAAVADGSADPGLFVDPGTGDVDRARVRQAVRLVAGDPLVRLPLKLVGRQELFEPLLPLVGDVPEVVRLRSAVAEIARQEALARRMAAHQGLAGGLVGFRVQVDRSTGHAGLLRRTAVCGKSRQRKRAAPKGGPKTERKDPS
jgi:hypothetical protein